MTAMETIMEIIYKNVDLVFGTALVFIMIYLIITGKSFDTNELSVISVGTFGIALLNRQRKN